MTTGARPLAEEGKLTPPPSVSPRLRWLAWFTTAISYLLLIGGMIVSKTDSGDACGRSWPLCQGVLLPENWSFSMLWEYSHRWVSGMVGIFVVIVILLAWRCCRHLRFVRTLSIISIVFIVIQAILGKLRVEFPDYHRSTVLAFHFGFSMLFFAGVVLLTLIIHRASYQSSEPFSSLVVSPALCVMVYGGLIAIYGVAYTGAWVAHMHAALACGTSFPHCHDGLWMPDWTTPAGIHRFHRWMAISLWVAFVSFALVVGRLRRSQRLAPVFFRRRLGWVAAILTGQVLLGVAVVVWGGSLWTSLLHSTFVMVGFTLLAELALRVRSRSVANL